MRHGHYMMGYGFYGAYILFVFFIIMVIAAVILFKVKQNKKFNFEQSLELLKERYVRDEITADEFREKKAVIDEINEVPNNVLLILVDRYVRGEIDTKEFYSKKSEITRK